MEKERESVEEGGEAFAKQFPDLSTSISNYDSAKLTPEGCLTFLTLSEFVLI